MPANSSAGDLPALSILKAASKIVRAEMKKVNSLLQDKDIDPSEINTRLSKFRSRSESIVVGNILCAVELKVENLVWEYHTLANSWYKNRFKRIQGQKKHVEERKVSKRYLEFIKAGQRYYRDHIQKLAIYFGGVPELEAIALKVSVEELEDEYKGVIEKELRSHVLSSCFYALIRLGDLSRWREHRRPDAAINWAPAIGFYHLAATIRPESGIPHNQLAVIAAATKKGSSSSLRAIYHFYRALTASEPHPEAESNLDREFKRIMPTPLSIPFPFTPFKPKVQQVDHEAQTLNDLVAWFIRLHAKCRAGTVLTDQETMEKRVLGYLTVNVREIAMPRLLMQLALVNLLAEYAAIRKVEASPNSMPLVQTRSYFTKLNVRFFTAVLDLLHVDLAEHLPDITWCVKSADDRVTPLMRRVLPCLRLYSSWLLWSLPLLTRPLHEGKFHESLMHDLKRMWSIYTRALQSMVDAFAASELIAIDYLLEEDSETIGFMPFQTPVVKERFLEDGKYRKADRHSAKRHHPNKEMLGRVRDFISDGLKLAEMRDSPIDISFKSHGADGPANEFEADIRPIFAYKTTLTFSPHSAAPDRRFSLESSHASSRFSTQSPSSMVEARKRSLSPDDMMQEYCEKMVDDLVGPDTTPNNPCYNYPRFQPRLPGDPPRSNTPPSWSFEDPAFDLQPFSKKNSPGKNPKVFQAQPMDWLSNNIEAGQLTGRKNVGDPYYHTSP